MGRVPQRATEVLVFASIILAGVGVHDVATDSLLGHGVSVDGDQNLIRFTGSDFHLVFDDSLIAIDNHPASLKFHWWVIESHQGRAVGIVSERAAHGFVIEVPGTNQLFVPWQISASGGATTKRNCEAGQEQNGSSASREAILKSNNHDRDYATRTAARN